MSSSAEPTGIVAFPRSPHVELGLGESDLVDMYYRMVLSRTADERMWILNRQGRAAFVISCQGHEAAQVGSARALRPGQDLFLPYYRDVGVVLSVGMTVREVMLGFLARAEDPSSGGRQMPNHWGHREHRILTGSSVVATQILHAAGAALAAKMRGEPSVVAVYFGDGCTSEGDFHEGLNFAGLYHLPVVFVCENNGWAISVPREKQMPTATVAERAAAYGFPGVVVDGTDVLAVYEATRAAADRARRGEGPTLIDAQTIRMTAHSSDDDDRVYRGADKEEARRRDPVERFRSYLLDQGILSADRDAELRRRAAAEVDEAVELAERSPLPRPESLHDHVYAAPAASRPSVADRLPRAA